MSQPVIKNIIVAGAAGNLGRTLIRKLLSEGKHVVGFVQSEEQARDLLAEPMYLKTNASIVLAGDLSLASEVKDLVSKATAFLGSVDAIVSTAGAFRYANIEESTEEMYDVLFNSNFKSCWLLAQAVLPQMKAARSGRIVFMSAKATQGIGAEGMSLYLASKSALNMLTLCLAREVREFGITVNAVMPTTIDTPQNRKDMPDADFSKWVLAQDLAGVLSSLLGQELAFVNGSLLSVPGKL